MPIAEASRAPPLPSVGPDFGDGSDQAVLDGLWTFAEAHGLIERCSTSTVLSAFEVGFNVQFDPDERRFRQKLVYVMLDDAGCVFYDDHPIEPVESLVGMSIAEVRSASFPVQIAVLDSLYSAHAAQAHCDEQIVFAGSHRQKALRRTTAICDEVTRLRDAVFGQAAACTASLIGVSSLQAKILAGRGFSIRAWDNDPAYVGREILPGVVVGAGTGPEAQLEGADIALISGMTIGNNSLIGILRAARRLGIRTVCWAVTASRLAPLFRSEGLTSAVCEGFPPYFLPGETTLKIFRNTDDG